MFIEKVTFDSKVLAPFDVKKEDIGNTNNLVDDEKQDKDDKEIPLNDKSNKKPSKSNEDEKSDSDEEEEVFKNILSTKGKMASFLQQQRVSIGGNGNSIAFTFLNITNYISIKIKMIILTIRRSKVDLY